MKNYVVPLLILLFLFMSGAVQSASPQITEKKIQHYIASHQVPALNLLEKLVNINSGTSNVPGVRRVGHLLQAQFKALGFKTYWIEEPAKMKRAGTLFAVHQGHRGKRILLIGHLDTVFPANGAFQTFTRHSKIAFGPGVVDDKGGDVVILYALKALQSVHALKDATIIVALTGDEEDSGKPTSISRRPLMDIAKTVDVALDFECSLGLDTATISRRGVSQYTIETNGLPTHSAQIFQPGGGDGAIFEMARILDAIRVTLSKEKYLSTNPGVLLGGRTVHFDQNTSQGNAFGKRNIIAQTAMTTSDLRFISPIQQKLAESQIKEIVAQHLPGTNASVKFVDGIPAMPITSGNLNLLQQYSQVSTDLGYKKVLPLGVLERGAGDISFVASMVPANLAGLGPLSAGDGAHSTHEGLNVRSMSIATERAAVLIYRLISS